MPPAIEGRGSYREVNSGYLGVNTRQDSTDVGQGNLISAINVDLYERPGVVLQRRGSKTLYDGMTGPIRALIPSHAGDMIAAGNDDMYVNGNAQSFDISPIYDVSMVKYRGRQSPISEVFVANGIDNVANYNMFKYRSSFGNWGIEPPSVTPVASAGTGARTGNYRAKYTYARYETGILVHESNPSPSSNAVSLSVQGLDVAVIASTDPSVTHIRLYRTAASGNTFLFDQIVSNTTATVTSTQDDSALGSAVDEDNDRPRPATILCLFRERIFMNDISTPGRLRWTKKYFPEAQPAANFVDIVGGDSQQLRAITSINGVLIVFSETSIFRVVEKAEDVLAIGGDIPFIGSSSEGYEYFELPSSRGSLAAKSVVTCEHGIIYAAKDGIYTLAGDFAPPTLLSQKVQNLFIGRSRHDIPAIDFQFENNLAATVYRGRYYLSYTSIECTTSQNDYTLVINLENGEAWFWDVGFDSFYVDAVQDRFLAGTLDGTIEILEASDAMDDNGTAITASWSTPSLSAGDDMIEKLYLYLRIDAKVDDLDTLSAMFYVDDVLEQTHVITGNRTRQLLRLPANSRGFTWRVSLSYQGIHPLEFHSVETQYKIFANS